MIKHESETYNIGFFKKGDVITRIKPAILKTSLGEINDVQFIGQKFIFLGIANGCIYLERTSTMEKLFNGQTFFIPFCNYELGWSYYEDPEFLEGKGNMTSMMEKAMREPRKLALNKLYKKAVDEENYKLAAKVQKELNAIEDDDSKEIDLNNLDDLLYNKLGDFFGAGGISGINLDGDPGDDEID